MKKILILICLIVSLSGCKSVGSEFVGGAEEKIRLKWAEEWKPALLSEVAGLTQEAKEAAISQATIELEQYRAKTEGKLERIGVQVENFDANQDGRISGTESLALLKEIKDKNDKSPNPLDWWDILLAVGAAYIPLTGAKELARKKIKPEQPVA